MEQYPNRRATHIQSYDYATPGSYYVTICTYERQMLLSRIIVGESLGAPASIASGFPFIGK